MLKNCSSCHSKHSPTFGKYCKHTNLGAMSLPVTDPPARDDPTYIDYLEAQLAATKDSKDSKEDDDSTLKSILSRLNQLELSAPASGVRYVPTNSTVGVPVTTSPMVTTACLVFAACYHCHHQHVSAMVSSTVPVYIF